MAPSEFWGMHPKEFWWTVEGHQERQEAMQRRQGKLTESEAMAMKQRLSEERVKAGYSP